MVLLRDGLTTGYGLAVGLLGAFWASRVLQSFLFGFNASDPATYGGVAAFAALICLLAGYLPPRRYARLPLGQILRR